MRAYQWALAAIVAAAGLGLVSIHAEEPAKKVGPDPDAWNKAVDNAIAYLKKHQDPDGGWSGDKSPGVTGIVLTGMLQTGTITADDPTARQALKYIEGLINPEAGHIAGKDPKVQLQNYVTSVNVMALVTPQ